MLVPFYRLKTLTQLRLNRTCIKRRRSVQLAVRANGCDIFLEN